MIDKKFITGRIILKDRRIMEMEEKQGDPKLASSLEHH